LMDLMYICQSTYKFIFVAGVLTEWYKSYMNTVGIFIINKCNFSFSSQNLVQKKNGYHPE